MQTYLFGDEGHDYIRGGDETMDTNIWGGSGDDFIRSGSKNMAVKIKAGKGDDVINETVQSADETMIGVTRRYDDPNMKIELADLFEEKKYGEEANMSEKFYGEQGHDTIWLGGKTAMDGFAFGGTGDDKLYGGHKAMGNTHLYGEAGRDTIRTDWFFSRDPTIAAGGDEYIWGDYKYGADNLDKDLWGDADTIYGGKGTPAFKQKIYGGDGSDIIHQGPTWLTGVVAGGNGGDTIYLGEDAFTDNIIFGNDGDDTVLNTLAYGDRVGLIMNEYYFGGAGNDYIASSHKAAGTAYIYGGDGHDRIV